MIISCDAVIVGCLDNNNTRYKNPILIFNPDCHIKILSFHLNIYVHCTYSKRFSKGWMAAWKIRLQCIRIKWEGKIFKILREWREKDRSVDRDKLIFFWWKNNLDLRVMMKAFDNIHSYVTAIITCLILLFWESSQSHTKNFYSSITDWSQL